MSLNNDTLDEDQDTQHSETSRSLSVVGGAMLAIGLLASVGYVLCNPKGNDGNSIKSISIKAKIMADAMVSAAMTLTQSVSNTDIPPSVSYESQNTKEDKYAQPETINVKKEEEQQETPKTVDADHEMTVEVYDDEEKEAMGVQEEEHEKVQQLKQEKLEKNKEITLQVHAHENQVTGVQEEEQNEKKELGSDATNNHTATPSRTETPPVAKKKCEITIACKNMDSEEKFKELNECNDPNRNHQMKTMGVKAVEEGEEDVIYWSETTVVKKYTDKSRKRKRSM